MFWEEGILRGQFIRTSPIFPTKLLAFWVNLQHLGRQLSMGSKHREGSFFSNSAGDFKHIFVSTPEIG